MYCSLPKKLRVNKLVKSWSLHNVCHTVVCKRHTTQHAQPKAILLTHIQKDKIHAHDKPQSFASRGRTCDRQVYVDCRHIYGCFGCCCVLCWWHWYPGLSNHPFGTLFWTVFSSVTTEWLACIVRQLNNKVSYWDNLEQRTGVASRRAPSATSPVRARLTCIFAGPSGYRRSVSPPCAHRSQGHPRQTLFVANTPVETVSEACTFLRFRSTKATCSAGFSLFVWIYNKCENLQDSPNLIDIVDLKTNPLREKGETKRCSTHVNKLSIYITQHLRIQR